MQIIIEDSKDKEDICKIFAIEEIVSEHDITLSCDDVQEILSCSGKKHLYIKESINKDSAFNAISQVFKDAKFSNQSVSKIENILISFHLHPSYPLMNLAAALDVIEIQVSEDATIIYGTKTDSSLDETYIKAIILLTTKK